MPHKSVDHYTGPFAGNDDGRVAYANIYMGMNDKPYTIVFDRVGRHLGQVPRDIRADLDLDAGAAPDVSWATQPKPFPKVNPPAPQAGAPPVPPA